MSSLVRPDPPDTAFPLELPNDPFDAAATQPEGLRHLLNGDRRGSNQPQHLLPTFLLTFLLTFLRTSRRQLPRPSTGAMGSAERDDDEPLSLLEGSAARLLGASCTFFNHCCRCRAPKPQPRRCGGRPRRRADCAVSETNAASESCSSGHACGQASGSRESRPCRRCQTSATWPP